LVPTTLWYGFGTSINSRGLKSDAVWHLVLGPSRDMQGSPYPK
jgi:hypothetical protein